MAAGTVDAVLRVLERGYRPYRGHIEGYVFESLGCRKVAEMRRKQREEEESKNFQRMLPVKRRFAQVAFAELPTVTVEELLKNKALLRVDEAAWCLSVSRREVYSLIDEGRLERHPAGPVRVT